MNSTKRQYAISDTYCLLLGDSILAVILHHVEKLVSHVVLSSTDNSLVGSPLSVASPKIGMNIKEVGVLTQPTFGM
jgi:hypothetical protein